MLELLLNVASQVLVVTSTGPSCNLLASGASPGTPSWLRSTPTLLTCKPDKVLLVDVPLIHALLLHLQPSAAAGQRPQAQRGVRGGRHQLIRVAVPHIRHSLPARGEGGQRASEQLSSRKQQSLLPPAWFRSFPQPRFEHAQAAQRAGAYLCPAQVASGAAVARVSYRYTQ